jgi:pantoate--beta-alanine ligase
MELLTTRNRIRYAVAAARDAGRLIGLVPTMGALHAGHLSLVAASRQSCDVTVATIFVNPTQFGPNEDFATYPRNLKADLEKLRTAGVDFVFAPPVEEMYPEGNTTRVDVESIAAPLEGAFRTGHFRGVATIVAKLFNLIPADIAFFGQKDYQQSLVVRRMVADLDMPVRIEVCPIVRDTDGLAVSSRNAYLSPAERERALSISRSLRVAEERLRGGERDALAIAARVRETLMSGGIDRVDYAAVVDAETLAPLAQIEGPTAVLIAAHVGRTRLIDNLLFRP